MTETHPRTMAPKTMNEEFEFVSSGPAGAVNDPDPSQFEQQFYEGQQFGEQSNNPIYAQNPYEPGVSDVVLKLATRDALVKYLTDASAYLNGDPFDEQLEAKMAKDKFALLAELTGLPTKASADALATSEPMAVLDVPWSSVTNLVALLDTNLESLIAYSISLSIGDETRNMLLQENHQMINTLLSTPMRMIPGRSPKKSFLNVLKDWHISVNVQTILIIVFLLVVLLNALNMVNKERAELEKKLTFQDEHLAYLRERLEKSKTCLNVDTLLEKSKELFGSLGEKSKDVYGDLDSLTERSKRYLSELYASYWS